MRGRPRTPTGHYGKIVTAEVAPKKWESRCWYRGVDGVSRRVRATGPSKTAAENALKVKLGKKRDGSGDVLTGATRVARAGELWLDHQQRLVESGDRAPRTFATYECAWRLHIEPRLGSLTLREATTAACEAWLVELRKTLGPSACSTARAVLSGVLGYATRMGVFPTNPVRDLSPIPGAGSRKRQPRAMTADERTTWLDWLDSHVAHDPNKPRRPELDRAADEVIAGRALGDITRLGLGTGARIGELMALSWDDVDLEAGTVAIRWHLVRVTGDGLLRMEGAKSEAGDRVLKLPRWAVTMLARRKLAAPPNSYPVFPDSLGGWRDPNLVMRWIRWSRDEAGFGWVTSHVMRQTVISVLDEAGLNTREVADQAGHSRVEQTNRYMARRVASERAAEALEGML